MSYTPTNWANGDVITTAKLNKIENGIAEAGNSGSNVLVVNIMKGTDNLTYILDKTWQQIYNAMSSGGAVVQDTEINGLFVIRAALIDSVSGDYVIKVDGQLFTINSASGYPAMYKGETPK